MSNDDEPILVKQIIVTLSCVYDQGLTFTTRDIELYPDEFEYYDPEDSYIFIYSGQGAYQYVFETFVKPDTSDDELNIIKQQIIEQFKDYLKQKISYLNNGLEILNDL